MYYLSIVSLSKQSAEVKIGLVIPVVVGSSPIVHPNLLSALPMSIKVILTCLAILSPFLILAAVIIFSGKPKE